MVAHSYIVREAPGPFGVNKKIWYEFIVSNTSGGNLPFTGLGTWVEQTGDFKASWKSLGGMKPGETLEWEDHIRIDKAGTFNLYLRVCFTDGQCVNLAGPVTVEVR